MFHRVHSGKQTEIEYPAAILKRPLLEGSDEIRATGLSSKES
jgi:hypothetical protein